MKRTRKWQFIGQEAQRLAALGMSDSDIARKLEVRQSTVSRWRQSGKLTRPKTGAGTPRAAGEIKGGPKAPAQWAAAVRKDYALDATDEQLVTMGEMALALARNEAETPTTRMVAMRTFQGIVKQLSLGLSDRAAEVVPDAPKAQAVPRVRTGVDPRSILSAVS